MTLPDPPGGNRRVSEAAALRSRLAAAEVQIAALRAAEEVHQALERATERAFYASDLERRITFWSEGARQLFGYEGRDILGRPNDLLFTPEDRAADVPGEELRAVLSRGRAPNERWLQRKDGSRFWASGVAMPLGGSGSARG